MNVFVACIQAIILIPADRNRCAVIVKHFPQSLIGLENFRSRSVNAFSGVRYSPLTILGGPDQGDKGLPGIVIEKGDGISCKSCGNDDITRYLRGKSMGRG